MGILLGLDFTFAELMCCMKNLATAKNNSKTQCKTLMNEEYTVGPILLLVSETLIQLHHQFVSVSVTSSN